MDNVVLSPQADGARIESPQAPLVASNPHGTGHIAGPGHCVQLDRTILGMTAITVSSTRQVPAW